MRGRGRAVELVGVEPETEAVARQVDAPLAADLAHAQGQRGLGARAAARCSGRQVTSRATAIGRDLHRLVVDLRERTVAVVDDDVLGRPPPQVDRLRARGRACRSGVRLVAVLTGSEEAADDLLLAGAVTRGRAATRTGSLIASPSDAALDDRAGLGQPAAAR